MIPTAFDILGDIPPNLESRYWDKKLPTPTRRALPPYMLSGRTRAHEFRRDSGDLDSVLGITID